MSFNRPRGRLDKIIPALYTIQKRGDFGHFLHERRDWASRRRAIMARTRNMIARKVTGTLSNQTPWRGVDARTR
jgi:hypothetical protein